MFSRETTSFIDNYFQETYASATRTNNSIQSNLQAVLNNFSLVDEAIDETEDEYLLS